MNSLIVVKLCIMITITFRYDLGRKQQLFNRYKKSQIYYFLSFFLILELRFYEYYHTFFLTSPKSITKNYYFNQNFLFILSFFNFNKFIFRRRKLLVLQYNDSFCFEFNLCVSPLWCNQYLSFKFK